MKIKQIRKPVFPITPKFSMAGKQLPRKLLTDSDMDGLANPVDCEPYNSDKQGWIGDKVRGLKEKYSEWKEKAPERRAERHEKRLENLQRRQEVAEAQSKLQATRTTTQQSKISIQKQRLELQRSRVNLQQQRVKAVPSLSGFDMGGRKPVYEKPSMSLMTPAPTLKNLETTNQPLVKQTKRRKTRKRRRR